MRTGRREREAGRVRERAQAATWSHGRTTGVAFGPPRSGFVLCAERAVTGPGETNPANLPGSPPQREGPGPPGRGRLPLRVPDPHSSVRSHRGEEVAAGAERHAVHPTARPLKVRTSSPVDASQKLIDRSRLAPARREPSGRNATPVHEVAAAPYRQASRSVQELIGWADTPCVAMGRAPVKLHLLDPSFRPVQITNDFRSFYSRRNWFFNIFS